MTPNLNTTFAALADPTRRALLARLAREEATVMELAQPFSMSQPAISRHLKVLEEAGLILRRVDGTRRPCRRAAAPAHWHANRYSLSVARATVAARPALRLPAEGCLRRPRSAIGERREQQTRQF